MTTVTDQFSEEQTDIAMQMGALGMQNPVAQMGDVALSVKGDAFIVGIGSDVREKLPLTEVGVQRVRFALQGETNRAMSETSVLTPRLRTGRSLGWRQRRHGCRCRNRRWPNIPAYTEWMGYRSTRSLSVRASRCRL